MINKLLALIKPNILFEKFGNPIGRDGRIRVHTFIDLFTPVHDSNFLNELSEIFVEYIKENGELEKIDSIIAPKRGNSILVKNCANLLLKNSGFIKESASFNRRIEGKIKPSERVLLVDDIGSDGEFLCDCVKYLRSEGVFVQSVIVLINRQEGDAKVRLTSLGVTYKYILEFDDQMLTKMS